MKSKQGIALIATLLTLVAIMTLGVGAFTLARMNLKVAENARSAVASEAQAEAGLEAAMLVLNKQYADGGSKFPASFTTAPQLSVPTATGTQTTTFPLADYAYAAAADRSGYTLTYKGRTLTGGLYKSEVLVRSTAGASPAPGSSNGPLGKGITAEGPITVNGGNVEYIDANVHGGTGYTLNGYKASQFKKCTSRHLITSVCLTKSDLGNPLLTATKGKSSYVCNPSNDATVCIGQKPTKLVDAPPVINVDYDTKRNAAIKPCTKTYSGSPLNSVLAVAQAGFTAGQVVCVTGGVNFPAGTSLAGVTVIANNDINFNGNNAILLSGSTLISKSGGVNINSNNLTVQDSQIFSQSSLNFNGNKTSFLGNTTLASKGSITVNGSSSATQNLLSKPTIGLGLIAEGDITLNGSSDWYASLIAKGNINYNGSATLYGSIGAKGGFTANGGITIDSSFSISNFITSTYFEGAATLTPTIASRR